MKKLLSIATLVLAFSPLAQAQNTMNNTLADHPDARNDRTMQTMAMEKNAKHEHKRMDNHKHRAAKHRHHRHAHAGK